MNAVEEKNLETVRRFYLECLNKQQPQVLPELVSEQIVLHPSERKGLDDFAVLLGELRKVFPDQQFRLEDLFAHEDRVAVRWTMSATHSAPLAGIPATGKRVTQDANVIYRLENGKLAELWVQMDALGMMRQLGAIPGQPQPNLGHTA